MFFFKKKNQKTFAVLLGGPGGHIGKFARGFCFFFSGTAIPCLLLAGLATPALARNGANPIQHVIIIMQENRSFDNYFGSFPGANGPPAGTCLPISLSDPGQGCVAPFHDVHDFSLGANHSADGAQHDLDDGISMAKMDGFVESQILSGLHTCDGSTTKPNCDGSGNSWTRHDTMGYHTADEIPNYWAYAQNFVLMDNLFSSVRSWSYPSHVYLSSEWLATCGNEDVASTCYSANTILNPKSATTHWPWVSIFNLLDAYKVSWKYYHTDGLEPDCDDEELDCGPQNQVQVSASIWNPAQFFLYVQQQGQAYLTAHTPSLDQLYLDLKGGTLPAVSWIVPNTDVSEHPYGNGITLGMEHVTSIVNAVMQSSAWNSTAIFVSWDDFGGFYDHVMPPNLEMADPMVNQRPDMSFVEGFGLRVPGLLISPWVKSGQIDHQFLSFANFNTFIEDLFMNGARLDPVALGNPDSRPSVRDAVTQVTYMDGTTAPVGNIMNDFDFSQQPLAPLILSTHIPGGIRTFCRDNVNDFTATCQKPTVTIMWTAVTGPQVPGPLTYHVQRDGTDLPQCVGTATTCTDQPGTGNHFYRLYSVNGNNVASPLSAAAEADEP
jgi:phospholipase C